MKITRGGDIASSRGPAEYFTGPVRLDMPFEGSGALAGATVTFEPGARTHWHTHPLGQTLLVTVGRGRVQREGGTIEEIASGDIVHVAADERHWHGAAPDTAMTHIAIAEKKHGSAVTWLEPVSDADYLGEASA